MVNKEQFFTITKQSPTAFFIHYKFQHFYFSAGVLALNIVCAKIKTCESDNKIDGACSAGPEVLQQCCELEI